MRQSTTLNGTGQQYHNAMGHDTTTTRHYTTTWQRRRYETRRRNDLTMTRQKGQRETQRSATMWRGNAEEREATTRGRETTQQPTNQTNKQTNKQTDKQTNKTGGTWGDNTARGEEDMTWGDGGSGCFFCVLLGGGGWLCRLTFGIGTSSKLTRLLSVRGTSMPGNQNTNVCRHTRNHVAKIGLSGRKFVTLSLVAGMLPTCCRHYQPRSSTETHKT